VAEHGLSDLSLRQLASALGTSHRMLLYHFGDKGGLIVGIIQRLEARQRAAFAAITAAAPPDASWADLLRLVWRQVSSPAFDAHQRLWFEIYGRALQGRDDAAGVLDGIVESWVEPSTTLGVAFGMTEAEARASSRLSLAVTRGLLLDLLATGDRAGADAAMEQYIAAVEAAGHLARRR
jgi:AcrR family transcriptional regulator